MNSSKQNTYHTLNPGSSIHHLERGQPDSKLPIGRARKKKKRNPGHAHHRRLGRRSASAPTEASTTSTRKAGQAKVAGPAGGGPHRVGAPDPVNTRGRGVMAITYPDCGPAERGAGTASGTEGQQSPGAFPQVLPTPRRATSHRRSEVTGSREPPAPSTAVASGTRLRWRASDVIAPWVGAPGLAPPTQAQVSELINTAPALVSHLCSFLACSPQLPQKK